MSPLSSGSAYHLLWRWFLAWLILRSWRWRCHASLKRRLNFNYLHGIMTHKTEPFITTAVRISNIIWLNFVKTFSFFSWYFLFLTLRVFFFLFPPLCSEFCYSVGRLYSVRRFTVWLPWMVDGSMMGVTIHHRPSHIVTRRTNLETSNTT
jgi:hypothetical protein